MNTIRELNVETSIYFICMSKRDAIYHHRIDSDEEKKNNQSNHLNWKRSLFLSVLDGCFPANDRRVNVHLGNLSVCVDHVDQMWLLLLLLLLNLKRSNLREEIEFLVDCHACLCGWGSRWVCWSSKMSRWTMRRQEKRKDCFDIHLFLICGGVHRCLESSLSSVRGSLARENAWIWVHMSDVNYRVMKKATDHSFNKDFWFTLLFCRRILRSERFSRRSIVGFHQLFSHVVFDFV